LSYAPVNSVANGINNLRDVAVAASLAPGQAAHPKVSTHKTTLRGLRHGRPKHCGDPIIISEDAADGLRQFPNYRR